MESQQKAHQQEIKEWVVFLLCHDFKDCSQFADNYAIACKKYPSGMNLYSGQIEFYWFDYCVEFQMNILTSFCAVLVIPTEHY